MNCTIQALEALLKCQSPSTNLYYYRVYYCMSVYASSIHRKTYARTEASEAFYDEIYAQGDGNEGTPPTPSSSPSSSLALEFHLRPETMDVFTRLAPEFRMAIHEPGTFSSDFVELSPGHSYSFRVTPSMITSDTPVLDMPEEKRQCRTRQELEPVRNTSKYCTCVHCSTNIAIANIVLIIYVYINKVVLFYPQVGCVPNGISGDGAA